MPMILGPFAISIYAIALYAGVAVVILIGLTLLLRKKK